MTDWRRGDDGRSTASTRAGMVTKRLGIHLLVPILIALLLTSTGCSILIASRGVSDLPMIALGSTRQEVRQTLGDPDSPETRGDGTRVETYRIPRKIKSPWGDSWSGSGDLKGMGGGPEAAAGLILAGVAALGYEVFYATPKAIYDSEKGKYSVALVYGPDDRRAYFYDEDAPPETRFATARRSVDARRLEQLKEDECPSWSACFTAYGDRLRTLAALESYTLSPTDAEKVQRLREVAREKDEGKISKEEALLYVLNRDDPPETQFVAVRRSLDELRWKQLENDSCPTWSGWLTAFIDRRRTLAELAGYTLLLKDEENFQRLREVASDKDGATITNGEALIGITGRNSDNPTRLTLDQALSQQLEADRCPSWVACVNFSESEYRRRAASEHYTIATEDERASKRILEIASAKDEGKMTKKDALGAMPLCPTGLYPRWCFR